jgi:hypothetical protein
LRSPAGTSHSDGSMIVRVKMWEKEQQEKPGREGSF